MFGLKWLSATRLKSLVVLAIGLGAIWGFTLLESRDHYNAVIQNAETETRLLATAFAEHANATVRLIEAASLELSSAWSEGRDSFTEEVGIWKKMLMPMALQIAVTDVAGKMVYSSLGMPSTVVDLSDREHIRVHLARQHEGLFISRPVLGRVSNKSSIQFSRPITRSGSLVGVLVISLDPDFFKAFYASLPLPKDSVVSMIRDSGDVMVRVPSGAHVGQVINTDHFRLDSTILDGNFRRISQTDEVDRIFGYRRSPDRGLILVASVTAASALAPYYEQHAIRLTAASALSITILLLVTVITREVEAVKRQKVALRDANLTLEDRVRLRTTELNASLEKIASLNRFQERLLASSPAVLYTLSFADFALTFISPNVSEKFGWTQADFAADPDIWQRIIHPGDLEAAKLTSALFYQGSSYSMRFRLKCKDGRYIWTSHELVARHDGDNRLVEVSGACWDVDSQVRLEDRLREAQKLEAIGQLTGGLAHDFNNLLGIIIGNLDRLSEFVATDSERAKVHHAALDAALRGSEITRSLLGVARRSPLEIENHELNALIKPMMRLVQASAGASTAVTLHLSSESLPTALDADGFSNVILNLVINSRDAMQEVPLPHVINLQTRREYIEKDDESLHQGWYAVLEISDNGAGMSPAVRAQACEPFFTTKERGKGTGLGLATAYGYANQIGGGIKIDSTEGDGTTIRIYFPIVEGSRVVADTSGKAPDAPAKATSGGAEVGLPQPVETGAENTEPTRRRVLVVDDEPELCELACNWVETLGFDAESAYGPNEALQRLASDRFDLLFTDIVMPGSMDGLALAVEARSRQSDLQILLTSGFARALLDRKELPGALLGKPYRKKELAAALAAIDWTAGPSITP